MSGMRSLFNHIDSNQEKYIKRLGDAVAIKSVSAEWEKRNEVIKQVNAIAEILKTLGATYELVETGTQDLDGHTIPLPPVILGNLGSDKSKKTVLVYGHLDVQPAKQSDGWDTDPFVLTRKDGKLYGRGATDDKGPVLCCLNAIEAYQDMNMDIPVNIKFCFEGMEESSSLGLDKVLEDHQDPWLKEVDYVMISDSYWLGLNKPCLTYGLRGICYFYVEVTCATRNLHSGIYGGAVHEAMTDVIALMNSLVDVNGKILVTDINNSVAKLTPEEAALYPPIDFDKEEFRTEIGANRLIQDTKEGVLMHRWRYPSLSLHGIAGASEGMVLQTVIPAKVTGKFSIRLVPDMDPDVVTKQVENYLTKVQTDRGSPNSIRVWAEAADDAWVTDFKDEHFTAGTKATKNVYGQDPDMTRSGGSIPVTLTIQNLIRDGVSIMLLPVGASDDGAHSQNEKINISNYIKGTKLLASYFDEVSKLTT